MSVLDRRTGTCVVHIMLSNTFMASGSPILIKGLAFSINMENFDRDLKLLEYRSKLNLPADQGAAM